MLWNSHIMVYLLQLQRKNYISELVDGLRGSGPCIGSGSQVAGRETYGTLGAVVRSRTGNQQVLWRGQHPSFQMIFGMVSLQEQIQLLCKIKEMLLSLQLGSHPTL